MVLSQWNFFFSGTGTSSNGAGIIKTDIQMAGSWAVLGIHACAMFWLGYGWWMFRQSGGIWGDKKETKTTKAVGAALNMA